MTKMRFLFLCVLLAVAAYCGLTIYPVVLFSSKYDYKNLTLYTHDPLTKSPDRLLSDIYAKISADDFYDPGQNFEVYLTGSYKEYSFLAPFCRKEFACVHPINSKVFVVSADIDKNISYGPTGAGMGRVLESVIVHEIVKAQIKNKVGVLSYFGMSDWRKEGYAEHVAMETGHLNPAAFCSGDGTDPAIPYLKNRLIVEMLRVEDEIRYPALIEENYSHEDVLSRVERKYCGKKL